MKPKSNHPKTCRVCNGTGWQPGPPIHTQAGGDPVTYTTSSPCQHEWRDDDPTVDEYGYDRTTPITFATYYQRLLARTHWGAHGAQQELDAWDRWLTTPTPRRWRE